MFGNVFEITVLGAFLLQAKNTIQNKTEADQDEIIRITKTYWEELWENWKNRLKIFFFQEFTLLNCASARGQWTWYMQT